MLTERIQEIQQNGNPKYPWELKALQDTLSNRIAYHDSEQSDSENSSAMSVDTMSLSEDNMIVDDTPCLINDNENPVSESHSSYKRQAKKLRHEKKKLRKQLRKQELHDPSISNSEFEIAKIYAYQHFAWKQFKIKQELNIFNFKRIKNFTDGDDDLVINKECFKICNYSNTARCVYSKFLEMAF
ncbi:unnamed protein product [[Candida] boidinii]|nr:unnamed protein product [[Candida] boidinii]